MAVDRRRRTTVDVLRQAAERDTDREAYVEPSIPGAGGSPRQALSFGEWDRAADGVARLLVDEGVGVGDVVAVMLPSSIDYAVVYAAAMRVGAITSGINARLGSLEIAGILERTRPRVLVAGDRLDLPGAPDRVLDRRTIRGAFDAGPPSSPPRLDPELPVAVVWTSSTTGIPKGAVFDHRHLEAVAAGTDALSRPEDRRLSPLPFAHVGYMTRPWDEIEHRVTTVITPTPWRAEDALGVLEHERITVAQGVPTQWRLILALPQLEAADLSAIRVVATGSAPASPELIAEMRRRLGAPVVVRYTSTEASLGTGTVPGDPDQVVATTVGRPVPGVELRLVDPMGGQAAPGEVGRVQLRSPAVMRGYWRGPGDPIDPAATAEVLDGEGWLTTGDFGRVGEDGNLRLVGREKERYLRGGYNVYPAEVEQVLAGHPAVRQAAVVGAEDPVLGQVGVAFVVPEDPGRRPTLAELRRHCRNLLADYKAPDAVVMVEALPLTPMMKLDRSQLDGPAARAAAARPLRPESDPPSPSSRSPLREETS